MPRTPTELAAELPDNVPAGEKVVFAIPDGARVIVNFGDGQGYTEPGRPLPSEAVAFTWEGLGLWLRPCQHPLGQYTPEEEESRRENERAARAEAKNKAGRFDERGRVENIRRHLREQAVAAQAGNVAGPTTTGPARPARYVDES